jgi:phosphoesterase RecJ-like protein
MTEANHSKDLADAVKLIQSARRIAIASHISPDSDAIGSTTGLGIALSGIDKQVVLLSADPVPENLRFLPASDQVTNSVPPDFEIELLIALDSSDGERLGEKFQPLLDGSLPVVNFDHHITNENYGTVNLVYGNCPATAEALLVLLDALSIDLTPDIATCLMAGLVGDTRGFGVEAVGPDTFLAAARLQAQCIDLPGIVSSVLHWRTVDILRLWGVGLAVLHFEDGILWTALRADRMRELDLANVGKPELSSLLITAQEADIAVVFTEKHDGKVDISFRAKPGFDVSNVAAELGGGGHRLAAGCLVDNPLDETIKMVVELLRQHNPDLSGSKV